MTREYLSSDAIFDATRWRAKASGHGNAKGAAGYKSLDDNEEGSFLGHIGDEVVVSPPAEGFHHIRIGAAWQNVVVERGGFFDRLFKKVTKQGVDIDLGCLYELQDGTRGAVQAFGDLYGSFKEAPYILLSPDDTTGDDDDDTNGDDEFIFVNGAHWNKIKRLLIYVYIYGGHVDWDDIRPQVQIVVPDEPPFVVHPHAHQSELDVCAIAGLENVRGAIKLTNYTEYFPGQAEMDRAFGFGIDWDDGEKE